MMILAAVRGGVLGEMLKLPWVNKFHKEALKYRRFGGPHSCVANTYGIRGTGK